MKLSLDEYFNELKTFGVSQFGIISTIEIEFSQEICELCKANICRNYDTSWACPPAVGTLSECISKCKTYKYALVFNSIYPLEDSFDFEGMQQGHKDFKRVCDKVYESLKTKIKDFQILSNEGCLRCTECTYPTDPCRFPEMLFPSIEGFGINVSSLAKTARINYINGKNTVTYFGMVLFNFE